MDRAISQYKSSRSQVFFKILVLKNFAIFTGKPLHWSLRPATLIKKRLWHRYFPANFAKFLKTPFSLNTSGQLLLYKTYGCCRIFRFTLNHELFLQMAGIENFPKYPWKQEFP